VGIERIDTLFRDPKWRSFLTPAAAGQADMDTPYTAGGVARRT
jgi:hypothetical protein